MKFSNELYTVSFKIGEVLVINHLEDVYRKIIGIFIASACRLQFILIYPYDVKGYSKSGMDIYKA